VIAGSGRKYAYDHDPILGSGNRPDSRRRRRAQMDVIDMAADWATIHPEI